MKYTLKKYIVFAAALIVLVSTSLYADRDHGPHNKHGDHGERYPTPHKDYRMDNRYDHNRSYPREGVIVRAIPDRRHPIHFHKRNYFYFGGVWYLPSGPSFVVVRPPLGIVVPVLPPFYTTVWFGGIPYYYANDVYYTWQSDLNGYQVTEPPAEKNQPEPSYQADQLFIYPKQGQSEQQQADDRYACHRWAADQTGYDPTKPRENNTGKTLDRQREDYNRAMKACLEGKGYSVR